MKKLLFAFLAIFSLAAVLPAQTNAPLLLQKPAVSRTHIAFVYAGDLWIVARDGGEARRLTSGVGIETDPFFSPDGSQIAFTGEYDGNVDVYLIPAAGGVPRRLSYHPGADRDRRLDARRKIDSFRFQPSGRLPPDSAIVYHSGRRKVPGSPSSPHGIRGRLFPGRGKPGLLAGAPCFPSLETLSRRPGIEDCGLRS